MSKRKCMVEVDEPNQEKKYSVESGRGQINDNMLKALVTSKLFQSKVEKSKKGKGSFTRKMKHKGKEPYSKVATSLFLNRAFSYALNVNAQF
ncbi:alternative ribosome-rescue factor A [Vibrio sp. TRT 21S02]|uniref:alternative ribosome-rescue factor A n=1 Tax=unclassified Vibrio TaxID=2614977 RepID=UPI003CF4FDC4